MSGASLSCTGSCLKLSLWDGLDVWHPTYCSPAKWAATVVHFAGSRRSSGTPASSVSGDTGPMGLVVMAELI